jgi:hypothetical protein
MPFWRTWRNITAFSTDSEGSMFFQNVGVRLQVHMELLPRRPIWMFYSLIMADFLIVISEYLIFVILFLNYVIKYKWVEVHLL